jgi:DNA-binding transcriptional LysR family regulator
MPAMDTLQSMKVFVKVAQRSGFASAARDLRLSPASVTKHITALEGRLGARLLDRTTRRVAMTEAGHLYLERCLECLQALEDADASVSELGREPRGLLKVTAPVDFAHSLTTSVLADFMQSYPGIVVDLRLSNRTVDLVEEGVDVAVRVARVLDGTFVARPLAMSRLAVWGAPEYFRKHGRPRVPEDLASHRMLVFGEPRPMDELTFERNSRHRSVKLKPAMVSNSGEALCLAIQRGVGLGLAPSFLAKDDFEAGLIEPVLPDWTLPAFRLFALYPHRRLLSSKVRVFVEALRTAYGMVAMIPGGQRPPHLVGLPPQR